jgi:hypothetical protein
VVVMCTPSHTLLIGPIVRRNSVAL